MAITSSQLVERALHKIAPLAQHEEAARLRAALSVNVRSALEEFGKAVLRGPDWSSLQKEFALTAVAGRVDLSAANVSANGILFDPYKSQVFVGASDEPATYVERVETLKNGGLPADTYFYSKRGQSLILLNTADSQTSTLAGTVRVVSNFVPLITEVSDEQQKTVIDILSEITVTGMSKEHNKLDAVESAAVGRA